MSDKSLVPVRLQPYLVAPLLLLLAATPAFRALGMVGVRPLTTWRGAVRHALALMFCFTGLAHFNRQRDALMQMVPARLPYPEHLVSLTGALEFLGAAGLVRPMTAARAGRGLAVLLILLFPANVQAARRQVAIGGKPATPLPFRTLVQGVFMGLLLWATRETAAES